MPSNVLEPFDTGSNYNFGDKMERPNAPRSAFNLSHNHITTIENAGSLIPVLLMETLPGDSLSLSVDSLIRVMPQVVPLYSRQRLYLYAFYSRCSDLWNHFQTFMTKGYAGTTVLEIPTLDWISSEATPSAPGNLYDYMGLPHGFDPTIGGINAMPFMMYLRIFRDYFMNRNYYIHDKRWLPDDDHDFMLDDMGHITSTPVEETPVAYQPRLGQLLYRDYASDYFTSALPFPQRGDTPSLSLDPSSSLSGKIPLKDVDFTNRVLVDRHQIINDTISGFSKEYLNGNPIANQVYATSPNASSPLAQVYRNSGMGVDLSQGSVNFTNLGFTLNQFRELAIAQRELEKMARTNGSYGDFGLTFFGIRSRAASDYRPTFIGSAYQSLVFSEVLQTSESTDPGSPLGTYGGHGISSTRDGNLGSVDCDDYGYIMVVASIMPDTYYFQGIDKKFTRSLQSDMFLPERARLGLIPILNRELFYSGNSSDEQMFAWQNPYDEYRYIPNRVSGLIADRNSLSFFPFTQARKFDYLPTYSQSFARADDVRKDFLAANEEVAYSAFFGFSIRGVRPLPYTPVPAQVI